MIKFFRDHEIMVVRKQQPLRVRITARAEEIRESILNKKLDLIRNKHELANLEETKRALEDWLREFDDEQQQSSEVHAPEVPPGLRQVLDRALGS
jgi:hypothetical protein